MTDWTKEQLALLNLSPGDSDYEDAKEAADRGWPAHKIAKLLNLDTKERCPDDRV